MDDSLYGKSCSLSKKEKLKYYTQIGYTSTLVFLENRVDKNGADTMIHHMLDNRKKNMILPYCELVIQILEYSDFNLDVEESVIKTQK